MTKDDYHSSKLKAMAKQNNYGTSPFDNFATDYDAWFDTDGKPIFDTEVQAFKMLLFSLPKPWLEIGVGSGRFAQALGIETGIDPSAGLVKIARKRGIKASIARGEQRIFKEESFGTVFLIVTFCFLDSPREVLKEVKRILKPEGKVVLGLVLKESPWGKFYQKKGTEGHRFYRYATFYGKDEVEKLLIQKGLVIEKMVSMLFQKPGNVNYVEEPKEGYYPDAGFTIIVAGKKTEIKE